MKEQPATTNQQKTVKDVENGAKNRMEKVLRTFSMRWATSVRGARP